MSAPFELTIPGWWKKKLVISDDDISYGSTKLPFTELSRISYHSTVTTTSVYFIPVSKSTSHSFFIATDETNISLTFPGGTQAQEVFNQLFLLSKKFFEPLIVKRLLSSIMRDETVSVGGLRINKNGFHKKTLFRGVVSVPWNQFAGTDLRAAVVHVYYLTDKNVRKEFTFIPLGTSNAAVLAELMGQCQNEFSKYSARGVRVCTGCGKETESDGKFCQHCGASLPSKH